MRLVFLFSLGLALLGFILFFRLAPNATELLWQASRSGEFLLPLVVVAALIDSLNPCAFSILLLTIAFLFSLGNLRRDVLRIGGAYILGLMLAYLSIGLGIIEAFHLFDTPRFMGKAGAFLLVALGVLSVINALFPRFPVRLHLPHAIHHKLADLMAKASLPGAFLLGGLVGICEFPCTGGPYLAILGLLHDTATYTQGFLYLLLYNLLFVSPLVLILLFASDPRLLLKIQIWQKQEKELVRTIAGLAMIALGTLILLS